MKHELSKETIAFQLEVETDECLKWLVNKDENILGAALYTIKSKEGEEEGLSLTIFIDNAATEICFTLSDLKKMIKCVKKGV